MFIQTERTPNPLTLKFLPGRDVAEGGAQFARGDDTARSPLAGTLLAIDGVEGIYLGADFVSVTKSEQADWMLLKPLILSDIMEHFTSGRPVLTGEGDAAAAPAVDEDEGTATSRELIDTRVRPAVAQDGGDIVFEGFDHGIVYLQMHGACSGCPSSTMTLKNGIETMLKHYVPEVVEVRQV